MKSSFWLERWEANEIGFHQAEINLHLQEHWPQMGLESGGKVFVPLSGKSADLLWLLAQGYRVMGVELSKVAVEAFFKENDLQAQVREQGDFQIYEIEGLEIWQGDFFQLQKADLSGVMAVFDRASLVALPPEMRKDYVEKIQEILPRGTQMLLVSMDYNQEEMQGPPFAVTNQEVLDLYSGFAKIHHLANHDIFQESPRFQERGLTRLKERVYGLILAEG